MSSRTPSVLWSPSIRTKSTGWLDLEPKRRADGKSLAELPAWNVILPNRRPRSPGILGSISIDSTCWQKRDKT